MLLNKYFASMKEAKSLSKQDEFSNGENNVEDFLVEDDMAIDDGLDTNLELEMEELKLEHLKLQEAQLKCKQRMILLNRIGKNTVQKPATNRCILPDGRIVVQNSSDRSEHGDNAFSAAGDSLTLPPMQRDQSHACLACGNLADLFCARCGLAPYCSKRCQQTDWVRRHRAVCHNLARSNEKNDKTPEKEPTVVPGPVQPVQDSNTRRYEKRNENNMSDRPNRNFTPQNKSHRTSSNFKNHNLRRPQQNKNNNEEEEEESFEPKDTKPPQPQVKPEPKKEKSPKQYTNEQSNLSSQKPVSVEPETSKHDTVKEVKITGTMTVSDATPVKKMIPKNYVVETLSLGDSVLLSADGTGEAGGFICLSLHESSERDYQLLCEDYSADCEADSDDYKPKPGELFSYCNPEDQAWYRARMLSATKMALIDSSKIVNISEGDKCRKITAKYERIPEFCCVLQADNVKIGDSLRATLASKTTDGYKVMLENAETGSSVGEGVISRWRPRVERAAKAATPAASIPEVPRPDVESGSTVLLVEADGGQAYVRPAAAPATRAFDGLLNDVLLYGMTAKPIENPPQKGDVVIAKYTDGNFYRALCKRTNVTQNKYLLEFIEFGNTEINTKETIIACPPELNLVSQPTVVSLVKLVTTSGLTAAATEYLENLKDTGAELILTLVDGAKSAPSGAAVNLTIAKNNESVNKKLEEMCTPGWKKMEESGGDVVLGDSSITCADSPNLMFSELEYLELPAGGCELDVLDLSILSCGSVNACVKGLPYAQHVFTTLTEQMAEYCNSEIGREPYVPKIEELCIAQCPPYPQWFRGAVCEHVEGPGGAALRVCFVDYGNLDDVPVSALRKIVPDFVRGLPALATHVEIEGFPKKPTEEMLVKALAHMQVNDEGRGTLTVTKCIKIEPGFYKVHAPDLLKAIGA